MTTYDKLKEWLTNQGLYYKLEPTNVSGIEAYLRALTQKMPELYKFCREAEVVPENSYNVFSQLVVREFKKQQTIAFIRS